MSLKFRISTLKLTSVSRLWILYTFFLASFVFFLFFLIKTPMNGDTYTYAYSIQNLSGANKVHYGYIFIGHLLFSFSKIFSLSPLVTIGLLSVISGTLSIILFYLVVFKISKNYVLSFLSAIILLFSGGFWIYSIHGEVYIPQLACILFTIFFVLEKRAFLASLFFIISVSITPSSVLSMPVILLLVYLNKYKRKQILYLFMTILLLFIIFTVKEFSKIPDIFNFAVYSPKVFFKHFSFFSIFKKIILDMIQVYGKSFGLLTLAAVFGFFILYKENRNVFWIMLFMILPFSTYIFNLGLMSEDHLIFSFLPVSFCASYGLIKLYEYYHKSYFKSYSLIIFLIFLEIWFSYNFYIYPEKMNSILLQNTVNNLKTNFESNAVLISDWTFGTAFWYLTQNETNYSLLTGRPVKYIQEDCLEQKKCIDRLKQKFWIDIPNILNFLTNEELIDIVIQNRREIYFADGKYNSSWLINFILPERILTDRNDQKKRFSRFSKFLEDTLKVKIKVVNIFDYPSRTVYLLEIDSV